MPVKVVGRKIVEVATGKTVGVAKSHRKAVIAAAIRNREHEKKLARSHK